MVAAVAVLLVVAGAAAQTLEEERADTEDQLAEAEDALEGAVAEESALQDSIAQNNAAIRETNGRIETLGGEVEQLEGRAGDARERLAAAEDQLTTVTRRVRLARGASDEAQERLAERLNEIYRSGAPDGFALLFEARSIADLIDAITFQQETVERDTLLVAQVQDAAGELADARERARTLRATRRERAQLAAERARSARQARASLASERNALTSLLGEREQALAGVQIDRAAFEAEVDALEASSERLAGLIEEREAERRRAEEAAAAAAAAAAPASLPTPSTGGVAPSASLIWPLNGLFVSPFGPRWGRLHAGIDISAPAGTTIVAAAPGTVFFVGTYYGYGQFVLIDHGGGLVTAYAHLSSYAVSNGQSVAAGQPVGAVGCTGSCFGDHLHFEVRVNGTPVDPLGYL